MSYVWQCLTLFFAADLLNAFYITLYHRGFAHGSVTFKPWMKKFLVKTGVWVTGIDPKIWVCMHRLHHAYSDTRRDPHSPAHLGIWGVMRGQFASYQWAMMGLQGKSNEYTQIVSDLDFPVMLHHKRRIWWLPQALHAIIALMIAWMTGGAWLGIAYWVGMMNHPIQGWAVNAFGHSRGYRNYQTPDQSTNNTLIAWLILGEGYQNNHHAYPTNAKFSRRWFEVDPGYGLCVIAQFFGALTIEKPPQEAVSKMSA